MIVALIKNVLRKFHLLPIFYRKFNFLFSSFDSLNPRNLSALKTAFKVAPKGNYFEFGVYTGFSLWFAIQIAEILKTKQTHFFAFDSFDGLPNPKGVDLVPDIFGNTFARGNFYASKQQVVERLSYYGANRKKYDLIPGFYEETLNANLLKRYRFGRASVVLVDCDLYESTKYVLDFLPNVLQNGTVILFDDWRLLDRRHGQQLAFLQWKKIHPEYSFRKLCDFGTGRGFIVVM